MTILNGASLAVDIPALAGVLLRTISNFGLLAVESGQP